MNPKTVIQTVRTPPVGLSDLLDNTTPVRCRLKKRSDGWLGKFRGMTFSEWTEHLTDEEREGFRALLSRSSFGCPSVVYPYNEYWAFRSFTHKVIRKLTYRLPRFLMRQLAAINHKVVSFGIRIVKFCDCRRRSIHKNACCLTGKYATEVLYIPVHGNFSNSF